MYESENVEIHAVDHCNLDCVGCSHGSPHLSERKEDPEKLKTALDRLWDHYQAPLVKILGGEPLLHREIDSIISAVKSTTDATVRLITNGTMLPHRYHLLSEVDEIHVSVYPDASIPDEDHLRTISSEIQTPITLQEFSHFRWEHAPPEYNGEQTDRIFESCKLYHNWECHTIRAGKFHPCPPIANWAEEGEAGLDLLADDVDVETGLNQLLDRDTPFEGCEECLGSVGKQFEHEFGWRDSDKQAPEDPIDYDYLQELESDSDAYNGCYDFNKKIMPNGETVEVT